jgi:hypothetical protein
VIRRGTTGTGLTRKAVVSWDEKADESDPEIASLLRCGTLSGLISELEQECFAITSGAGLPNAHGSYVFDQAGEWRDDRRSSRARLTVANEIWPLARARGHAPDSNVGFAARMLDDIVWLQRNRRVGDHDRAALFAFYLGVKRAERSVKQSHGNRSRPAEPARKTKRDVELAREFLRRKQTTRQSDSALKAAIGSQQSPPLRRSAAIAAVDRGLMILSG